jgi:tRNA(fMet)-specific endonuclease VapC
MRYLLDTCVLGDFARGDPSTQNHLVQTPPRDLAVSTITEMEVEYGLRANSNASRRLKPVMDDLLSLVSLLPYDSAAARATGKLRAFLNRSGRPIGGYDALIAGTALAHDLILVTSNVREFERIKQLRIEDWRH